MQKTEALKARLWDNEQLKIYSRVLLIGTYFGILLVKTEVAVWERVNQMFLFEDAYMYLVIGTAVLVGGLGMFIIKKRNIKTIDDKPIIYKPKPYHKGVIIGGTLFGMGWAITGACPGPIYVQIASGAWPALLTFIGALVGMYLYAYLQPKLPH